MATTIISKYGSGAPSASDVVRGELAVDTENGRLYTETSGGSVIEIGLNPSSNVDVTGSVTADGLTIDGSSTMTGQDALYLKKSLDASEPALRLQTVNDSYATTWAVGQLVGSLDVGFSHYNGSSWSEKLRITTAGEVGIGTNNPNYGQLEISDTSHGTRKVLAMSTKDGSNTPRAFIEYTTASDDQKVVFNSSFSTGSGYADWSFLNGNVGIGTSSSAAPVHVQRNGTAVSGVDAQTVATFQSTGSSGSSSYIGILGGSTGSTGQAGIHFGDADDSDVGQIIYRNTDNSMAFVTNTTERMRIDTSGFVLIGTDTSGGDGASFKPRASGSGTTTQLLFNRADTTNTGYPLLFENNGTQVGSISHTNTATAFNTSSDYRLKENVVTLSGATERLKQLKPSRFNFIANPNTTVDGFLAHEVQDIVPEAITGAKDAVDDEGNPVYQGIDQSKLVPLLVATIQELEARIAALEGAN